MLPCLPNLKQVNLARLGSHFLLYLLLAPVGYFDDLVKPTKWRSSRPCWHMWNAWRFHEDWSLGL